LFEKGGKNGKFWDFASELLLEVFELFVFNAVDSHGDDFLDEGLNGGKGTFLEMTRTLLRGRSSFRICWI